jgi:hypothetical protein
MSVNSPCLCDLIVEWLSVPVSSSCKLRVVGLIPDGVFYLFIYFCPGKFGSITSRILSHAIIIFDPDICLVDFVIVF